MNTNPLHIFIQYDHWAMHHLFVRLHQLDESKLDQPFPIGFGTIRKTLVHVIASYEYWYDRAMLRSDPRYRTVPEASLAELIDRYERIWSDIAEMIHGSEREYLEEVITGQFGRSGGGVVEHRYPRGGVLMNSLNHATHHRAQCLNMLRHLGAKDLPDIDMIDSLQEVVK